MKLKVENQTTLANRRRPVNPETDDWSKISGWLTNYAALDRNIRHLSDMRDKLGYHIRRFLEDRGWDSWQDPDTKIKASLVEVKEAKVDPRLLRVVLKKSDYDAIVTNLDSHRLVVSTDLDRARLNKYIKRQLSGCPDSVNRSGDKREFAA